jgi:predicted molibdopterin-dependent oxidoreductase YjgC
MEHVGTICTHCSDGCKTTLGVRNDEIIRGNNRDRSGINGEFLCAKGRYAFDFYDHAGPYSIAAWCVKGRESWSLFRGRKLWNHWSAIKFKEAIRLAVGRNLA